MKYYTKIIGLLTILTGVLLLGNNLNFWIFKLNLLFLLVATLIVSGILIMDNTIIFRATTFILTALVFIFMFLLLFCITRDSLDRVMTPKKSREVYELNFKGHLNKNEAESRIDQVLDYVYKDKPGERLNVGFIFYRR